MQSIMLIYHNVIYMYIYIHLSPLCKGHSDLDSLAPHLLRSLRQLSPALSDKLSKLEFNISSDEQEAAGQEAGWEEHVMVAELMEVDKNGVCVCVRVCVCIKVR